jgi:hypothetical protein
MINPHGQLHFFYLIAPPKSIRNDGVAMKCPTSTKEDKGVPKNRRKGLVRNPDAVFRPLLQRRYNGCDKRFARKGCEKRIDKTAS